MLIFSKVNLDKHNSLSEIKEAELLQHVQQVFNTCFLEEFRTQLVGGADEPFYRAPKDGELGVIHFRSNFLRSALHETAHWCLAGLKRLKLDDWGYWYEPDGRSLEQQNTFFKVEVKPQAIELSFCLALGLDFDVSVDNLGGPVGPVKKFEASVFKQFEDYKKEGFPKRAEVFRKALSLS